MMRRTAVCFVLLMAVPMLAGSSSPRVREFELTYSARIGVLPREAGRVDVWLPYPVSDAHQEVTVTSISVPRYKVLQDPEYGNSILHFSLASPREPVIAVEMKIRVRRKEYVRKDFKLAAGARETTAPSARWSQPNRRVPLDERIAQLAQEVTKGKRNDLAKARAIYDYVVDTMSYDKSGTGWGNGDIYWACDAKRGNCTDFHALLIGLSRAVGLPAKFAIGFQIPHDRGQGTVNGYHCWAELYLRGYGWLPVDASEAKKHLEKREYFFGAHDENRVQFTVGRDIALEPRQAGERLNYFIYPYVEVDGLPFSKIATSFGFRDKEERAASGFDKTLASPRLKLAGSGLDSRAVPKFRGMDLKLLGAILSRPAWF